MDETSDCSDKDSVEYCNSKDGDYRNLESDESMHEIHEEEFGNFSGDNDFNRKLLCIKYPGNVINEEKAIVTLGGLNEISNAAETKNRRLELRFRPENGYCKPACGDRHSTCGFLLRVKVKKHRISTSAQTNSSLKNSQEESVNRITEKIAFCNMKQEFSSQSKSASASQTQSETEEHEVCETKILGRVDTEFRFETLCDFQYLPITQNLNNPEKNECIYESIHPVEIPPFDWVDQKVPYLLPPAAFSRMDSVQQYTPKTEIKSSTTENVIGKTRKRRSGLSNVAYFTSKTVPNKPPKGIETAMKIKFLQTIHLEKIKKLFEQRPIWSKNALLYHTKFTHEQLKILLPSVAYYFMNGPWRIMWVKLGFDPRKDPTTRIHQTLDYRLKAMHGLQSTVKCKRNYSEYSLPYKSAPSAKPKTMVLSQNINCEEIPQKKEKHLNENVYIYREGMVPPSRQMFYQYIDVQVPEIQEMISKLPDPLPEIKCHGKNGWLPSGFDDRCREIINKQVRMVLRKILNVPEDHPTKLPSRRRLEYPRKKKPGKSEKKAKVSKASQPGPGPSSAAQNSDDDWQDIPGTSISVIDCSP